MAGRIARQKTLLLIESSLIVVIMLALVLLVALQVFGLAGIVAAVGGVLMLALLSRRRGRPEIPRNLAPVTREMAPELYAILEELTSRAGLKQRPSVYLLPEELMNAATLETREGPIIVLTPSAVRQLDRRQLIGILAHEVAHLEYRDTILLQLTAIVHTITQSIANVAWFMLILFFPLLIFSESAFPFYLLLLLFGAPIASVLLQLAFSRSRELNADLGAVELTGDPEGLAKALEQIDRVQSYTLSLLFPFKRPKQRSSVFRSHPNIPERVRRLRRIAGDR
jgi:heat shock protein HtpX